MTKPLCVSTDDWETVAQYHSPDGSDVEPPSAGFVFTPDGSTLIGSDFGIFGEGRITFMDGATLGHLGEIDCAHNGGVFDLAVNANGTMPASAGADGVVRVWDIETRSVLHQIPISDSGAAGAVEFRGNNRLLVANMANGSLDVVTIDTQELLAIARSRITRGFTEVECAAYRIDPCPTLKDVKAS